jgi:acyl dehydratase
VNSLEPLFWEDLVPGGSLTSAPSVIDRTELVEFARTWDPLPFHVDEEAGQKAFGGIAAPGLYMLAVKQRLIHTMRPHEVIASLGYDKVRFHRPLRPGDSVHLQEQWLERRDSRSKSDRGIVTLLFSLINQAGEIVMSHRDSIIVRKRSPEGSSNVG